MNLSESYKKRLQELSGVISEKISVDHDRVVISEPYAGVQKFQIGNRTIYIIFGNVDYYLNKQSILAIKRKPSEFSLDTDSYKDFLDEFKKRFYSIPELAESDMIVSVETTSPVTKEMASMIDIPFTDSGFKKINPALKMKDIDLKDRAAVKNLFRMEFNLPENGVICVMDDFITTGTTFKNAFDMIPENIKAVGICLFKLDS